MKIGILTQPLHTNYGGLLQAFALQKYLSMQGHDVLTVDIPFRKPKLFGIKGIALNIIHKYLLGREVKRIFPATESEKARVSQYTSRFIKDNIKTTKFIENVEKIKLLEEYKFDAYVVGSDQVWRPAYSPGLTTYFLDFLDNDSKTRKIAYAPSFGIDNCKEFSEKQIHDCAVLAKKFHAISIREDAGVVLCKNYFGVEAQHVIDPTLLLEKQVYIDLVTKDNVPPCTGNMMVYVLDQSDEKREIIKKIIDEKTIKPYSIMPDISSGIYPPVTKWLRGFMDADYVVTDSFHGVAFSILFNKPFIAIGNKDRGLARFTSILKKFDLSDRLILKKSDLTLQKMNSTIDYERVNELLSLEKKNSELFLNNALG